MKLKIKLALLILPLLIGMTLLVGSAETLQPEVFLADADFTVVGEENGDWTAYFASPAGDVNGDGLGDFLVGAPMAGNKVCPYPDPTDCSGLPKGEGRAYLVLGKPENEWPASPMNLVNADAAFLGCEINSMTARQLYTAGDVNGDGYDDILISGWKCGENFRGKTYLILGKPEADWGRDFPLDTQADASFLGEVENDFSSYYTSTAGDVNGDGFDDILISSTHNDENGEDAGQIYLILGKPEADWGRDYSLSNADATFFGEDIGDRLGRATAPAGDVNGDGIEDFLIGSISSDDGALDAGETYLILGREAADWGKDVPIDQAADASFLGEGEGDESGRRMAAAGDVNGDGFDDFIIGGSKNDEFGIDSGKTYLILGKESADWGDDFPLSQADAIFIGEERRDQSGRRVSGAGDPNNDGYDDFLIGAPHNSRNGEASGTAYLIYGRPEADWGQQFSLANADVAYLGKPEIGVAGYDVAWVGDFNGDLIDDFLIAAYGGRNNDTVPGEAYLILGNDLPQVEVLSPADGLKVAIGTAVQFEGIASDGLDGDLTGQLVWTSSIDGDIGTGGSFETILSEGTHKITAQVTDSGGFTVKNQITVIWGPAPEITILSPSDGAIVDVGMPIQFSGTAIDFEDGDISASLSWSSSIDGVIGTGASFENAGLSVGKHEITASATDSDGKTGSAIVKVRVIEDTAPMVPTPISPSGAITTTTPTFIWSREVDTTEYKLAVYNNDTGSYSIIKYVNASACGASECAYTPTTTLPYGSYKWKVLAINSVGWSAYSSFLSFSITSEGLTSPGVPTPISPSGAITTTTPKFTWSKEANATEYKLAVYNNDTASYSIIKYVNASACGSTECSYTHSSALAAGSYKWKVLAINSVGWSAYSSFLSFSINSSIPAVPTPISPSGAITDTTPTFTWSKEDTATEYKLAVYNNDTASYSIIKYINASACGAAKCAYTPTTTLPYGSYKWKVLAINSVGWSAYSSFLSFSIDSSVITAPAIPTPISPSGAITDTTPTFTWSKEDTATEYKLAVYNNDTVSYSIIKYINASACGATECTYTHGSALAAGSYKWKVLAINSVGWSAYSSFLPFSIDSSVTTAPAIPAPLSLDGTITYTYH